MVKGKKVGLIGRLALGAGALTGLTGMVGGCNEALMNECSMLAAQQLVISAADGTARTLTEGPRAPTVNVYNNGTQGTQVNAIPSGQPTPIKRYHYYFKNISSITGYYVGEGEDGLNYIIHDDKTGRDEHIRKEQLKQMVLVN